MKIILISILVLLGLKPIYAQQDSAFQKAYESQILENNNLKNDLKLEKSKYLELRKTFNIDTLELKKRIIRLDGDLEKCERKLEKLEKFKKEKGDIESHLEQNESTISMLRDSVSSLKDSITVINNNISEEIIKGEKKAKEEFQKGKEYEIAKIVMYYQTTKFDSLLLLSTKLSVQRDLSYISDTSEVNQILLDLIIYFNSIGLLENKYDEKVINESIIQLGIIERKSDLLDKLKENIKYYKDYDEGLNKMIEELIKNDERTITEGQPKEIQIQKYGEILTVISKYIFDYDFNFSDYPYLSNIVVEIIKVKKVNPDKDISYLLE